MILNVESEESMLDFYKKFVRELGIIEYLLNIIIGVDSKLKFDEKIVYFKIFVFVKV